MQIFMQIPPTNQIRFNPMQEQFSTLEY